MRGQGQDESVKSEKKLAMIEWNKIIKLKGERIKCQK